MITQSLDGGFAAPAIEAAHAFRSVMEAMARPGTVRTLSGAAPPAPLSIAAGVAVLTLCDADTPVCLAGRCNTPAVRDWIAFHTGAPFAGPAECMFALGSWAALAPPSSYAIGTAKYPDRSATLIVEVATLTASGAELRGPGIRDKAALSLPDRDVFRVNHAHYPLGLDFLFTCGDRIAALPRSTEVL